MLAHLSTVGPVQESKPANTTNAFVRRAKKSRGAGGGQSRGSFQTEGGGDPQKSKTPKVELFEITSSRGPGDWPTEVVGGLA